MEEDLRLHRDLQSPPVLSDPELTRSGSASSSSAITADKEFSRNCTDSSFPDESARWTDQQHSLYLSSLEASFVNELHRSINLRGWSFQNNTDGAYKHRTLQKSVNMPKQSLALQDGCQKKTKLERIAPMLESTADSHVHAGSQLGLIPIDRACSLKEHHTYDHDLPCDEEIHAKGSLPFTNKSPRSSAKKQCLFPSFHAESSCSSAEVTDQNFKDEVASSSTMPMAKRLKTAAADGSSRDQVVPFEKFHTSDVSNATSEKKEHELQSELRASIHIPKSDLRYFLKGR
ncbi:cold-regulated protein 28 [Lotus japonicus]|uniref:cold-regulated protein 28 n=1 Tax=Lotus japonicus TaxID=34305 RepID=UPI00258A8741|nr:cold-regulated protein 28 [Lotus japonicus]